MLTVLGQLETHACTDGTHKCSHFSNVHFVYPWHMHQVLMRALCNKCASTLESNACTEHTDCLLYRIFSLGSLKVGGWG